MTGARWIRSMGVIVSVVAVVGAFLAVVGWSVERSAMADRWAEWNSTAWHSEIALSERDAVSLIGPEDSGDELTNGSDRTVTVAATATSLVRVLPTAAPSPWEHRLPDLGLGLLGAALVGWIVLLALKARRFDSSERTFR